MAGGIADAYLAVPGTCLEVCDCAVEVGDEAGVEVEAGVEAEVGDWVWVQDWDWV